jgi:penicillin-binding protein 1C
MKKFFFLILFLWSFWGSYEFLSICRVLDIPDDRIGSIEIYERNGNTISDIPLKWWYSKEYKDSFHYPLIKNIITVEDNRFFSHRGVDIYGKLGALYENYTAWSIVRWGSTITEQYIKNRYFPSAPRTILQKIQESFWSMTMELKFSKEEILKKYLETVYMGNGLYGIPAALSAYFPDESIETLSTDATLELITRIKYPNLTKWHDEYAKKISKRLGLPELTRVLEKWQKPTSLNTFPFVTERIQSEIKKYCSGLDNTLEYFIIEIPLSLCEKNALQVYTALDYDIHIDLMKILESTIAPLIEKNVHNASVYVWSEKEKKVLAYIGNRVDTQQNAVDMITRKRSVGSVLKPFIYIMALEGGANMDSLILDESRIYETEVEKKAYVPQNYIPKAYGPITLREALWNSLNSAAVRLSEYIGIGRIYERFRSLGFPLEHEAGYYGYGISLGTVELSLEDIVHGYRNIVWLSDPENFLMYQILSDEKNRSKTFGISSILNTSVPLAVKTGTSSNFRDNWVIGYNEDIIVGVWVGNTDNESMDDVSGITGAGPLYHGVVEKLIESGFITDSPRELPRGTSQEYLCLDSNCLQKSSTYIKNGWSRKSRPINSLYYASDFIGPMSEEEKIKWKIQ